MTKTTYLFNWSQSNPRQSETEFDIPSPCLWSPPRSIITGLLLFKAIFFLINAWALQGLGQQQSSRRISSLTRPNLILINLDDADVDLFTDQMLEYFPNIQKLSRRSLRLTNCHVNAPLCGPSRASLLRGQYPHRVNVRTNVAKGRLNNGFTGGYETFKANGGEAENIGVWMQRSGYRTMMIGKYAHGLANPDGVPGWDDWLCSLGGDYYGMFRYLKRVQDPHERRKRLDESIYRTTYEAEEADWMISEHARRIQQQQRPQPFFLYLAPLAPHLASKGGVMSEKRYANALPDLKLIGSPDLNEVDVSDKPKAIQREKFSDRLMEQMHQNHRTRAITIKSIDDMVGRILQSLHQNGFAENTYLFFTSDHGYQLGHNRMVAKKMPFHRCTVVPMMIAGPDVIPGQSDQLIQQIDLIPTFLEMAGATTPVSLDAKSIMNLMKKESARQKEHHDSILIQNWEAKNQMGKVNSAEYVSLRMATSIFTQWANGEQEFYDLVEDPYQLENRISEISQQQQEKWRTRMRELKRGGHPPQVTLANQKKFGRHEKIRGFVDVDSAIGSVQVQIHHNEYGYWNGEKWNHQSAWLTANLENPDGLLSGWSVNCRYEQFEELTDIRVVAVATDRAGTRSQTAKSDYQVDVVDPVAILKLPENGSTVGVKTMLFGTASDDQMLSGIELTLIRLDDGKFYDGVDWVDGETTFLKRLRQNRWHRDLVLAPGRYKASARAIDASGNYDLTPSVTEFSVTDAADRDE